MTAPQTTSAPFEVGYRKPPRSTQFQKGQSGNPGGRPRRSRTRRLEDLALYEAYRTTIVMEDGHAVPMPVIQAVLRCQLQSAASGNVRAQRDILAMIQHIEVVRDVFGDGSADDHVVDDDDVDDTDDTDDTDDADAYDSDDNDVDDTAGADRDDAGGDDDDEPARQQADGIDTYGERRQDEREPTAPPAVSTPQPENVAAPPAGRHPPLKGEGRIAEGDPGWGGGGAGDDRDAAYAEAPSPPPGPLTRADLPPAEPRYSEGSATQQSDRSRQQPTPVGGGDLRPGGLHDGAPSPPDDEAIAPSPPDGEAVAGPSPSGDKDTEQPWPDLVLIDGGEGQLRAACDTLAELGIVDIPIVGIAKGPDRDAGRETFRMVGREPFRLPTRDPVLYFVQRLRDEAHRFAVGSHRQRRRRDIREGGLQEIAGVGPTRKRALLRHFGTLKAVERASIADLTQVSGISAETARRIYDFFHESAH
jgi:UvrC RIbonuclease H-like domain/Family of unknown function (DUF5681)/Helix-hairpin-helix domain